MAVFAYPAVTFAVIIVTANHFFLDAAMGALTAGAGFAAAGFVQRVRRDTPDESPTGTRLLDPIRVRALR